MFSLSLGLKDPNLNGVSVSTSFVFGLGLVIETQTFLISVSSLKLGNVRST